MHIQWRRGRYVGFEKVILLLKGNLKFRKTLSVGCLHESFSYMMKYMRYNMCHGNWYKGKQSCQGKFQKIYFNINMSKQRHLQIFFICILSVWITIYKYIADQSKSGWCCCLVWNIQGLKDYLCSKTGIQILDIYFYYWF